ncbi:MAG TPA: quinol:electron acceptor oxidoreductase subunit ActD [Terriglobales bacterium]|nr:quinol:electron acceptor oxidoreductase subunit ActD [Terriglobales bacterium]
MSSAKGIFVLCSEPDRTERAVNVLRSLGTPMSDIIVISSEPLARYRFRELEKVRMPWLVLCGAILAGLGGFLLASLTQKSPAIPTGGMPVLTLWTDGIVTYELAMLGAILTTSVVFLLSARLLFGKHLPYDPQVSEGKVMVGIASAPDALRNKIAEMFAAIGEIRE